MRLHMQTSLLQTISINILYQAFQLANIFHNEMKVVLVKNILLST